MRHRFLDYREARADPPSSHRRVQHRHPSSIRGSSRWPYLRIRLPLKHAKGSVEASRIAALPFAATAYQAFAVPERECRRPLALGDRDEPRPLGVWSSYDNFKDVHEHLVVCSIPVARFRPRTRRSDPDAMLSQAPRCAGLSRWGHAYGYTWGWRAELLELLRNA
jgi:hypothetical protein